MPDPGRVEEGGLLAAAAVGRGVGRVPDDLAAGVDAQRTELVSVVFNRPRSRSLAAAIEEGRDAWSAELMVETPTTCPRCLNGVGLAVVAADRAQGSISSPPL